MGEIVGAQEIIGQSFLNEPLIVILAYVILIVTIINYGYKVFMVLYNKKHGIDTKEENIVKSIEMLKESIDQLKELHENDINTLRTKEKNDYDKMMSIIEDTAKKQEDEAKRASKADQAILRSDIIKLCKEFKKAYWIISPTDKENLDNLFKNYYANGGNGLIKDLEKTYREKDRKSVV